MTNTITGQGRLKLGADTLEMSFTVPVAECSPQAVLPDVQRFANEVTALATAKIEAAGLRISCTKGCGACCRQMVPVSPVEARHLAAVVEAMPPERDAAVRARFEAARARMTELGLEPQGHPDTDKAAYRAFGLSWFRAGMPCPFLEDESCSIHASRPLVCREYLVTSPPAACAVLGSGEVRKVAVPVRVWDVFARSTSADGQLQWMPLTDALAYAGEHPEPPPSLTGPQHIETFLKQLSSKPAPDQ
jgi:Fe-S-cluster containining protein